MLRTLSHVLQSLSTHYEPQWKAAFPDVFAANPKFGEIRHAVVCKDEIPLYDLPVWTEPRGAICIAVTNSGKLVFLDHYRETPIPSNRYYYPNSPLVESGMNSLELPRGFAEPGESPDVTALRELKEETGFIGEEIKYIGEVCANTTYCAATIPVYRTFVARRETSSAEDTEIIHRVCEMTLGEYLRLIRDQATPAITKESLSTVDEMNDLSRRVICALSKAAVLMYLAQMSADELKEHFAS